MYHQEIYGGESSYLTTQMIAHVKLRDVFGLELRYLRDAVPPN